MLVDFQHLDIEASTNLVLDREFCLAGSVQFSLGRPCTEGGGRTCADVLLQDVQNQLAVYD